MSISLFGNARERYMIGAETKEIIVTIVLVYFRIFGVSSFAK